GKTRRASTKNRLAQKLETRALLSAAARPLWTGKAQLPAFHQSDSALCRSGRASRIGTARRETATANRHEPDHLDRRARFNNRARRGRCRNRIGSDEEARVLPTPARRTQPADLSRRNCRCP